jgi:tellurite resistance protein TerC
MSCRRIVKPEKFSPGSVGSADALRARPCRRRRLVLPDRISPIAASSATGATGSPVLASFAREPERGMQTIGEWWMWAGFAVFVVVAVAIDLLVLRSQGPHKVSVREALGWSGLWIAVSLIFCALLWWYLTGESGRAVADAKATEFLTGYLIEKSLSVDNVFVFLMIFSYFAVPNESQKRVLVIGIVGAIVLRAIMILIGAWLISHFHFVLYLFGLFLLVTGLKMFWFADAEHDFERNPVLRWMRGHLAIAQEFRGEAMRWYEEGRWWYSPLFVVAVLIGVTDVIFAVDSIPAVYAVTEDPFIVMTANVFAILGLRALYFLLADMKERFHLLSYGLAAVLVFVGLKMLLVDWIPLQPWVGLTVVAGILAASVVLSLAVPPSPRPLSKGGEA